MKLRTKIAMIAVPAAALGAFATITVVRTVRKHRRRKARHAAFKRPNPVVAVARGHVVPAQTREQVEELLRLRGEDFVPEGIGTSLYQRRLGKMSDKELLALFALTQVGAYAREHGVDPLHPSDEAKAEAARLFKGVAAGDEQTRSELLGHLGAFGRDMLGDSLRLAKAVLSGGDLVGAALDVAPLASASTSALATA